MHRAILFGFEDRDPGVRCDSRAKARSSDPAADNYDVKITHLLDGYELESRAV
jgi:hypothetical protein